MTASYHHGETRAITFTLAQVTGRDIESLVEVTPLPEPDHAIAEQFAKIARDDTERAVCILDRMVRGDREGWHIHGWLDAAKQTLETAMMAGGDARTQAEQVIDYLG
jgi:hypothetical protein